MNRMWQLGLTVSPKNFKTFNRYYYLFRFDFMIVQYIICFRKSIILSFSLNMLLQKCFSLLSVCVWLKNIKIKNFVTLFSIKMVYIQSLFNIFDEISFFVKVEYKKLVLINFRAYEKSFHSIKQTSVLNHYKKSYNNEIDRKCFTWRRDARGYIFPVSNVRKKARLVRF